MKYIRLKVDLHFAALCALLAFMFSPEQSFSFYEKTGDNYGVNVNGSVNAGLGMARNPVDTFIYTSEEEVFWNGDLRLVADLFAGKKFKAEVNVLQNIRSTPLLTLPGTRSGQLEIERSSLFFRQQHDTGNSQASFTLDTVNFSLGDDASELIIGRQPINLSVTFYFTPNDFFAPFAPQNFYRVYKPGVDAVRYERRIADLSQLTIVGVLGFYEDSDTGSGWSRAPDWQRTSIIGRFTTVRGDFEWGALGGVLREYSVVGTSLQGEFFDWLGIRAEGNYKASWKEDLRNGLELSVGLEHRFSGRMIARLEQLHNGTGYSSIKEVNEALADGTMQSGYLGRDYTAFAVNYEFTPLLFGDFLYLRNWTDSSQSFSFNSVYSLSDESELACTLTIPLGDRPEEGGIRTEFGSLPARLSVEYRLYF